MLINNLLLTSFRNFDKKKFIISSKTTIVIGPNASGKTSLIEAIFLLSNARSFRAEREAEVVSFGKDIGRVRGEIELSSDQAIKQSRSEEIELEIVLTKGQVMGVITPIKRFSVNGAGKRIVDFVGKLKVVLFWPEDLQLVTDSPTMRRRYLDFVLAQIDREYRRSLGSYERGIRQRNKLLEAIRDKGAHRHQLQFWDQLLIKSGEYITWKREEYISYLNRLELRTQNSELNKYQLDYDKSVISRQRLDQYSNEEIAAGVTLVGPHRDDIKFKVQSSKFKVNDDELRDLSHYGSRGEQRLAILWLKLGELAYLEEKSGEKPVLLLDDILSELDHEHRKIIFDVIGNQQTIMTTTDMHLIEKDRLQNVKIIELDNS